MSVNTAFQPYAGQNLNLTANPTSATATIGLGANQLRITVKAGGGDLYVHTYDSRIPGAARAATTADYCIVAGQSSTFTKGAGSDTIAYITDTGATAVFKAIPGEGM